MTSSLSKGHYKNRRIASIFNDLNDVTNAWDLLFNDILNAHIPTRMAKTRKVIVILLLNSVLKHIYKWSKRNRLSIHLGQSKVMLISTTSFTDPFQELEKTPIEWNLPCQRATLVSKLTVHCLCRATLMTYVRATQRNLEL